jgi:hypothetical protein
VELSTKWEAERCEAFTHRRFNPQVIAGRVGQILPNPEVPLRGLNGLVAERNLDLLDGSFSPVRELCKCSPCRASSSPISRGSFGDGEVDGLRGKGLSRYTARLADWRL